MLSGILNLNKPVGRTSFSVVAQVKRLSGVRRVGHAGTLDPLASGVLPVCLGKATRVVQFLMDTTKVYQAEIKLGVATDSYDATGNVVFKGETAGIMEFTVCTALQSFQGLIQQEPPMYSALKYQGKPLYQLARQGITIERRERWVNISSVELISYQMPYLTIKVECGKGTYIRSLANDLGKLLGCGAMLTELVRLRCGIFNIEDAVSSEELETAFQTDAISKLIYPLDSVLGKWNAVNLGEDAELDMIHGRPPPGGDNFTAADTFQKGRLRAYNLKGEFIGILRYDDEKSGWLVEKVFL